jgi:thiol-disulfide isomerase/thioredoxin
MMRSGTLGKKGALTLFLILTAAGLSGCISEQASQGEERRAWMEIELTDVATGRSFKISDFAGKPVLLESFAVWCPTCTEQQKQTKELESRVGDAIIHVSLDTDPNEDEARVREHIETNGFNWYYAVSPIELTNSLRSEFGNTIISAPLVPMILICEDQSTRFLRSGIKTADDLLSEVDRGC